MCLNRIVESSKGDEFHDGRINLFCLQQIYHLLGCEEMKDATRPIITLEKEAATDMEKFQNQTLRPILKLQNELLISFFQNQALEKKINLEKLESDKLKNIVRNTLQKDINFRTLMIGIVCGHFSELETEIYFQYKAEANRRIVTMIIERLCSQF
jgi:hypothetical protein